MRAETLHMAWWVWTLRCCSVLFCVVESTKSYKLPRCWTDETLLYFHQLTHFSFNATINEYSLLFKQIDREILNERRKFKNKNMMMIHKTYTNTMLRMTHILYLLFNLMRLKVRKKLFYWDDVPSRNGIELRGMMAGTMKRYPRVMTVNKPRLFRRLFIQFSMASNQQQK